MIKLKNIYKSYNNKKVLKDISFEVEEGEIISLLGPSGCGKTTTLKIIAGLLKPDEGDVLIDEKSVLNVPVEKRGAVIVFQEYLLFPHLNVEENIAFGLKMAKVSKTNISIQVEKMLELVQLKGYNKKYPNELSGGEQQRIALARALAIKPKVLLLDEPFSNLDTKLREDMRELTLKIQQKLNITTILVTHDKEEALMSSDKIGVMLNGHIKQFDTPMYIYKKPNSIEVANFFGDKNYIDGTVLNGEFTSDIINFKTKALNSHKAKAMIKSEDIVLFPKGEKPIKGIIKFAKYAGDRVYYTIKVKNIELKAVSQSPTMYNVGDNITLHINYEHVVIFTNDYL